MVDRKVWTTLVTKEAYVPGESEFVSLRFLVDI